MEDGAIVYIDYDLFIVDTGDLIETTRSEVAKEHDQLDENKTYEPLIVTVGEGSLIEGFENHLKEAEADTDYEFDIPPEEAYGERDANAVETFSEGKLALLIGGKEVENLRVGGPVTVEGKQGTIKMFAAGRARVDFNHPLAGRTLHYDYRITKVVEDREEKVHTILKMNTRLEEGFEVEFDGDDVSITIPEFLGYDQNWGMAKFAIIRALHDNVGVGTIRFIEEHKKREVGELDEEHEHEHEHEHEGEHAHGEEE